PLLQLRKRYLGEPGTRAGAEEADVVRDLRERDGDRLQRARCLHDPVTRRLGLEGVGRRRDLEACLVGEQLADERRKLRMRVETRASCSTAERDLSQPWQGIANARDALAYLGRIARELLAERDGNGIHPVRPPRFDDIVELPRLRLERGRKT